MLSQTLSLSWSSYKLWKYLGICIDQGNLFERSSQVQMMGALYERARLIILWLGPEDETVSDAFFVLESLGLVGRVIRSKEQIEEVKVAWSYIRE